MRSAYEIPKPSKKKKKKKDRDLEEVYVKLASPLTVWICT